MTEPTLESLAKRVEELERKVAELAAPPAKDWRRVAGMFTRTELSDQVDEEIRLSREAEREAARRGEFNEES